MATLCPGPNESKARFIFRWFMGVFVFGLVIGFLLTMWLSSNHCVDMAALQQIVFWTFIVSAIVATVTFLICSFGGTTTQTY